MTTEIHKELDSEAIANKNFEILNNELAVKIQVNLSHGSTIANLILFFYSILSLTLFSIFYRRGSLKAIRNRQSEKERIKALEKKSQSQQQILQGLTHERQELFKNIEVLNTKYQTDKEKIKMNEEEMFEEILCLEGQLNTFIELKKTGKTKLMNLNPPYKNMKEGKGLNQGGMNLIFCQSFFQSFIKIL